MVDRLSVECRRLVLPEMKSDVVDITGCLKKGDRKVLVMIRVTEALAGRSQKMRYSHR
jgi:hypothetical protein